MLTTEDEAKTKLCPEAFGPGGIDGWITTPPNRLCIGSACMAWRQAIPAYPGEVHGTNTDTGETFYRKGTQRPAIGYCGKAGRP